MAKQRVMVIGGGLAGLGAAMKLAELGVDVDCDESHTGEAFA